jgi:predicted dinucleotide-binding enzyme
MHIGIIGAGSIGSTLAHQYTAAGHAVRIANSRGPATLTDIADRTGAEAVELKTIATDAEALILAVPFGAIPALTDTISNSPSDLTVIDAGNYVPGARDAVIGKIEDGMNESTWVQAALRHHITKALNTVAAASLADHRDRDGDHRIALPISGDDEHSIQIAIELGNAIGFDSFHAASLADSWRQQPGTPVYTRDLDLGAARTAITNARNEDTIAWRRAMMRLASR